MRENVEQNIVWIGKEDKVASFHKVEGYEECPFTCAEHFRDFLCSLQESGYRFQ